MAEANAIESVEDFAAKQFTAKDRAVINAQVEVMAHRSDFEAAGIPLEQIQQAAVNAENRVLAEFEQKEKEDPIRQYVEVLHEEAQTEDEKTYSTQVEKRLEERRKELSQTLRAQRKIAERGSREFKLQETLQSLDSQNLLPMAARTIFDNETQIGWELMPPFVGKPGGRPGVDTILLSREHETRVLKRMGVLDPDESLNDLDYYPSAHQELVNTEKPFSYNSATGIRYTENLVPASIPNGEKMRVRVDLGGYPSVTVRTKDSELIQKIAEFPNSS